MPARDFVNWAPKQQQASSEKKKLNSQAVKSSILLLSFPLVGCWVEGFEHELSARNNEFFGKETLQMQPQTAPKEKKEPCTITSFREALSQNGHNMFFFKLQAARNVQTKTSLSSSSALRNQDFAKFQTPSPNSTCALRVAAEQ